MCFQAHHLETGLDGLDTARGVAGHALQEEQPRLLVQDRVRGSAIESCNIPSMDGAGGTCMCGR